MLMVIITMTLKVPELADWFRISDRISICISTTDPNFMRCIIAHELNYISELIVNHTEKRKH